MWKKNLLKKLTNSMFVLSCNDDKRIQNPLKRYENMHTESIK